MLQLTLFSVLGSTYKFRAESDNSALQWYRRLYHAAQLVHQPDTKLPDNLISFDWLILTFISCVLFGLGENLIKKNYRLFYELPRQFRYYYTL